MPNLNVETRLALDGRLTDQEIEDCVEQLIVPRVSEGLLHTSVYGEKNLTYGPFVPALHSKLDCKFVFLSRDGRDVVRSFLDWHSCKFGTIYRECRETGDVTDDAFSVAASLPAHLDTSDYSRPRPLPTEPLYAEWEDLSRLEMCAYYWNRTNKIYLDQLAKIADSKWIHMDYTNPTAEDVMNVVRFLGLTGLGVDQVENMLAARINSLNDRGIKGERITPEWRDWPLEWRRRFDQFTAPMMKRLGYSP